ncbi:MAG: hypothetical protein VX583_04395 [Bdellovibrionota bacterium]
MSLVQHFIFCVLVLFSSALLAQEEIDLREEVVYNLVREVPKLFADKLLDEAQNRIKDLSGGKPLQFSRVGLSYYDEQSKGIRAYYLEVKNSEKLLFYYGFAKTLNREGDSPTRLSLLVPFGDDAKLMEITLFDRIPGLSLDEILKRHELGKVSLDIQLSSQVQNYLEALIEKGPVLSGSKSFALPAKKQFPSPIKSLSIEGQEKETLKGISQMKRQKFSSYLLLGVSGLFGSYSAFYMAVSVFAGEIIPMMLSGTLGFIAYQAGYSSMEQVKNIKSKIENAKTKLLDLDRQRSLVNDINEARLQWIRLLNSGVVNNCRSAGSKI